MADPSIITVTYTEYEGPQDGIDQQGLFWARRVLKCAWADRITLMQQLKGGYYNADGIWQLPAQYPWFDRAYVVDVSAEPYVSSTGANATYDHSNDYAAALVSVQYRLVRGSINSSDPTRSYEWSSSSSTEMLAVPVDDQVAPIYYYDGKRVPRDMAPMRLISVVQWHLNIKQALTITANTESMMGHVNVAEITTHLPDNYSGSWPIDTLRYDGYSANETLDTKANLRWNLTLNFSKIILPVDNNSAVSGWQHAFPVGSAVPQRMYMDGSHVTELLIFPRAALSTLLGEYL